MLENCKSAQERWGGVSSIIDKWLGERQGMLVTYCTLSDDINQLDGAQLRTLCQDLVDYVSVGHFEIFNQLEQEGRDLNDIEGLRSASGFYKVIGSTTEDILDFNDKYQEVDDLETIESDLSRLGEILATRFESEDKMIEVLHYAHQEQIEQVT